MLTGNTQREPNDRMHHRVRCQAWDGRQAGRSFRGLVPEIQAIGGFISMDNFQSQTRPGVMLEVSYWRDERALNAWIDNVAHRSTMPLGRNEIFSWYKISSTEVKRQIDWTREA